MEPITSKAIGRWRRPGFLLEPLGWVQDRLAKAIETEPTLVELLFELDQSRMHLTALALAHMTGEITPESQRRPSPCRHRPCVVSFTAQSPYRRNLSKPDRLAPRSGHCQVFAS